MPAGPGATPTPGWGPAQVRHEWSYRGGADCFAYSFCPGPRGRPRRRPGATGHLSLDHAEGIVHVCVLGNLPNCRLRPFRLGAELPLGAAVIEAPRCLGVRTDFFREGNLCCPKQGLVLDKQAVELRLQASCQLRCHLERRAAVRGIVGRNQDAAKGGAGGRGGVGGGHAGGGGSEEDSRGRAANRRGQSFHFKRTAADERSPGGGRVFTRQPLHGRCSAQTGADGRQTHGAGPPPVH